MNRYLLIALGFALLALPGSAQEEKPSLGTVARQYRADKKPSNAKILTNDDIPSVDTIRPAGATPAAVAASTEAVAGDQPTRVAADKSMAEKTQKLADEWKVRVGDAKKGITDAEHELDILDREHKLQVANFYADAGNRLRNDRSWADQERKFDDDMAAKKAAIDAAKAKLDDLRDAARKAGVPAGQLD